VTACQLAASALELPVYAYDARPVFTISCGTNSISTQLGHSKLLRGMGRFLSPDAIAGNLSNPQSLNLYSYVMNNPLTNLDPTGLDCLYFNDAGTGLDPNGGIDRDNSSQSLNQQASNCGSNGGAYVNGTVDAGSVNYNQNTDTFNVNSSDTSNNYFSIVTATGPSAYGANGSDVTNGVLFQSRSGYDPSVLPSLNFAVPGAPTAPPGTHFIGPNPQPARLTSSEISNFCASAAMLGNGGTVPGDIAPSLPSVEAPASYMQVPSNKARFAAEEQQTAAFRTNENASNLEGPAALASVYGTYAACVGTVSIANR
jgi:hypothetical protein